MKKIIPAIILAMTLVSCGTSGLKKANNELRDRLAETNAALDSLMLANDELTLKVEELEKYNYWYDSQEGDKLIASGIEDPETYIADQLRDNPELIPTEAILGGTMFFWNVQLLGKEWVIADYTDGHIAGKAIYRYQAGDNGEVKFSLMANQID